MFYHPEPETRNSRFQCILDPIGREEKSKTLLEERNTDRKLKVLSWTLVVLGELVSNYRNQSI